MALSRICCKKLALKNAPPRKNDTENMRFIDDEEANSKLETKTKHSENLRPEKSDLGGIFLFLYTPTSPRTTRYEYLGAGKKMTKIDQGRRMTRTYCTAKGMCFSSSACEVSNSDVQGIK